MNLRRITAFRLVTTRPEALVPFYGALGFVLGDRMPIGADEMAMLGLEGSGERIALRLGEQHIDLDVFQHAGAPYPSTASACDLVFQHFALVTQDAAQAWARARGAGAHPIGQDAPVTLPKSSGGVTAIKFRDPEGHPLEFLQFPPGAHDPRQASGIDHSAISVSNVATSQAFYEGRGLSPGIATLNYGSEQEAMDGLAGVRVRVLPMTTDPSSPHLELLGYRVPHGRRGPPRLANDIAATRVVWSGEKEAVFPDPDGHLHQISPPE